MLIREGVNQYGSTELQRKACLNEWKLNDAVCGVTREAGTAHFSSGKQATNPRLRKHAQIKSVIYTLTGEGGVRDGILNRKSNKYTAVWRVTEKF